MIDADDDDNTSYDSLKAWLAARPASVRALAERFEINSVYLIEGVRHYLIGYAEPDSLILSPVRPDLDYDRAMEKKIVICAKHFIYKGVES